MKPFTFHFQITFSREYVYPVDRVDLVDFFLRRQMKIHNDEPNLSWVCTNSITGILIQVSIRLLLPFNKHGLVVYQSR